MSAQNALSLEDQRSIRPSCETHFGRKMKQNPYDAVKNPTGVIDMGSAVNELMLDDLSGWMKKNVKESRLRDALGYGNKQGSASLPMAAARFINEHFRVRLPLTSDNVLAGNDTEALLDTLMHSIAEEGDAILIPTPSCGISAGGIWAKSGIHVVEVPCDDIAEERFWGPPPQEDALIQTPELVKRLEAAIDVELSQQRKVGAIFLANPDNPLGRCYAAHMLLQVSQLCAKHEIHLIVDETHAMSSGDRFSSILSLGLGMNDTRVHVLWGMSKDFGLGRLGAAFLATYNKQIYDTMTSLGTPEWMSSFSAKVLEKLLSDAKYLRNHYLPLFRRRLNKRRNLVEEVLEDHGIPYGKAEAGFFIFVDLSSWADLSNRKHGGEGCSALLEHMMTQRVFLEPGETFCAKRPGLFRLSFGGEKEPSKLGLRRLLYCLRKIDGKEYTDPFALAKGLYFSMPKGAAHISMP
ncbi:aminotransferase class I and II [Colletotrichum falcatum]|nr:aminotransferase class I and II [Colletotrichum falcatum]